MRRAQLHAHVASKKKVVTHFFFHSLFSSFVCASSKNSKKPRPRRKTRDLLPFQRFNGATAREGETKRENKNLFKKRAPSWKSKRGTPLDLVPLPFQVHSALLNSVRLADQVSLITNASYAPANIGQWTWQLANQTAVIVSFTLKCRSRKSPD